MAAAAGMRLLLPVWSSEEKGIFLLQFLLHQPFSCHWGVQALGEHFLLETAAQLPSAPTMALPRGQSTRSSYLIVTVPAISEEVYFGAVAAAYWV